MSATNGVSSSEPAGAAETAQTSVDMPVQHWRLRPLQERWAHRRAQRAGALTRSRQWTRQRIVGGLRKHAPVALLDVLAVLLAHQVAVLLRFDGSVPAD